MMPSPEIAVVLALATYRVTRLIVKDTITEPLRRQLIRLEIASAGEPDWQGTPTREPRLWLLILGKLAYMLTCPFCCGFWISLGFVWLYAYWPTQTDTAALVLAIAAVQCVLTDREP